MKLWMKVVLGVVTVVAFVAYLYRDMVLFFIAMTLISPDTPFAEVTPPAAPDYHQSSAWAALPHRKDEVDTVPYGYEDNQNAAAVDVFFVHPTTYITDNSWNQPLDDATTNERTDEFVMRGQASAFNGCCAIYAPRYRQATLYSFMDDSGDGPQALALAYNDVKAAFDHFLNHYSKGRPFILAGHSQGSNHLDKLLREDIFGTALEERLVAAYPIGFSLANDGIRVCQSSDETGCIVTWNSVGPDVGSYGDPSNNICVNPLTWRQDNVHADHSANIGAMSFDADRLEPGAADAICSGGQLTVSEIRSDNFDSEPMGEDNYHIYDYNLFYASIHDNAIERVNKYLNDL